MQKGKLIKNNDGVILLITFAQTVALYPVRLMYVRKRGGCSGGHLIGYIRQVSWRMCGRGGEDVLIKDSYASGLKENLISRTLTE